MSRILIFRVLLLVLGSSMSGLLCATEPSSKEIDYPDRAITVLVPYAAGGPSDTLTRIVTDHMSRTLRQQIRVESIVGAGGTTASLRVKRSAPDGYTILTGNMGTHGAAVGLYSKLAYDPRTDFEPIGILAIAPRHPGQKGFTPQRFERIRPLSKGERSQARGGTWGGWIYPLYRMSSA
jgi:tripartite-type tricarboxylate transporter receptor subunit TctC